MGREYIREQEVRSKTDLEATLRLYENFEDAATKFVGNTSGASVEAYIDTETFYSPPAALGIRRLNLSGNNELVGALVIAGLTETDSIEISCWLNEKNAETGGQN